MILRDGKESLLDHYLQIQYFENVEKVGETDEIQDHSAGPEISENLDEGDLIGVLLLWIGGFLFRRCIPA